MYFGPSLLERCSLPANTTTPPPSPAKRTCDGALVPCSRLRASDPAPGLAKVEHLADLSLRPHKSALGVIERSIWLEVRRRLRDLLQMLRAHAVRFGDRCNLVQFRVGQLIEFLHRRCSFTGDRGRRRSATLVSASVVGNTNRSHALSQCWCRKEMEQCYRRVQRTPATSSASRHR